MVHSPNPSIPCGVEESIADACEGENDDDYWVGRVRGDDYVSQQFAQRTDVSYSSSTGKTVHAVTEEGGECVAGEGGEEDEGGDEVGEIVVCFDL